MVAIVVGLWAIQELSFDKFHTNSDRIYRVAMNLTLNDNPIKLSSTWAPLAKQAKDELPEIEDCIRVTLREQVDIRINEVLHQKAESYFADSNFFSFFTFPLVVGDPKEVLSSPNKVVISQSAAARYFAGKDPIGQFIKTWEDDYVVSGIMKDMPRNSSLQADFIFSYTGRWKQGADETKWGYGDAWMTFFRLQENANVIAMSELLSELVYKHSPIDKTAGVTYSLEVLNDMHFDTGFQFDRIVKGNKALIMTFVLTALIILIISCINFTNLFVSTSFIRAKNIGIKKTLGAKKSRLMREFYMETAYYVLISIGIALLLASLIIPGFNNFTQSNLVLDFASPHMYIFLIVLLISVVFLAGSFPALYMTRFNIIETIKGKFKGKKMGLLQKSLVVAQFTASIVLLIIVAFMQKQVNHIINYDLGFDKEQVLQIRFPYLAKDKYTSLEAEFLQEPSIKAVTRAQGTPSEWMGGTVVRRVPAIDTTTILMEWSTVNPNYFDFFGMKIIDGENPFLNVSDSVQLFDVVINERAAQLLGYENPVGEKLQFVGEDESGERAFLTIKGIVRNAYTKSLHQDIEPQVYLKLHEPHWGVPNPAFFKIEGDPQRAIAHIEKIWTRYETVYPFEYYFLDDTYEKLYTTEMNANKVFVFAMLIAILITVAGLFAMVYYAIQRRMREIAIRKVYGASVKDIFILLNKNFVLWVIIAFAIACPLAYFGLQQWLSGFAIKTPLSIWIFVLVGILALLITLLTTGYQTWKAATENPVKAIKVE
jgi:putative ABC transport system permease protein